MKCVSTISKNDTNDFLILSIGANWTSEAAFPDEYYKVIIGRVGNTNGANFGLVEGSGTACRLRDSGKAHDLGAWVLLMFLGGGSLTRVLSPTTRGSLSK